MDHSEQQGNEQAAADAAGDGVQAPSAKAPRRRRTASAPAGAPPAQPPAEDVPATRPSTSRSRRAASAPDAGATPSDTITRADAPARAPRTRRRAATAEAGPARLPEQATTTPEDVASPEGIPEAPSTAPTPAEDTAPAAEPAEKAPRTRRPSTRSRRATAEQDSRSVTVEPSIDPADGVSDAAPDGTSDEDGSAASGRTPRKRASRRSSRSRSAQHPSTDEPAAGESGTDQPTTDEDTEHTEQTGRPTREVVATGTAGAANAADTDTDTDTEDTLPDDSATRFDPFAVPESPLSLLFHAPDLSTATVPSVKVAPARDDAADEQETSGEDGEDSSRRPRRSRRVRGRNRGESAGTQDDAAEAPVESSSTTGPEEVSGTGTRRRRRRRRGDQDLELTGGEDDDPPNTVTRVRAPRQSTEPVSDRVTSVRGSTRLEAKKQRRRDSRDTGRRRQVITEAEFLARRESVDRQMIVRQRDDRIQIGVLEDGILAEHFVSRTQQDSLIGNVYVGKVQNVLPSMEAAFIDIGRGRNAVLYAGEVNWDAAGLEGQPRRIELALKSGDPVLVQVTKDPVGHKGARLTSQISLPGRYLVYVPGGSMTGISRKLPDVERNRLKRILKDRLPENAGVIVRTAAEGASEEELTHDINRLRAQWEEIERKAGSTKTLAPELLYGEPDLTIKVVRDVFNEDFSKLVVSGEEAWDTIEAYVMYVAPDLVGRLEKWTGEEDIFSASRIDEQIAKALDRKVFLPSGGSLVIDRTEAMTVVDVNTGKFTGSGGNLEETVTKNNLEAAEEVVRQLRLRDIGGIIVIDFIDMVLEANRDLVLRRLVECLGRDRTKHQVAEVTSLGLVQMTRKRMGTGLLEVFGEECEHCAGRGVITQSEPVEHRHTPAGPESGQQQVRQGQDRPSRSERKRNRGRGQQQDDVVPQPAAEDGPERAARAETARAALASIAAATHHAAEEPAKQSAGEPDIEVTEAVLTINGETVTLPRAETRDGADQEQELVPETRLTLDSLSEAFNRTPTAADAVPAVADAGTGPAPVEEQAAAPAPVRRQRPRRVARSAQGAADTTVETDDVADVAPPTGTRYVATASTAERRPADTGSEPLVFGVGVPASEL